QQTQQRYQQSNAKQQAVPHFHHKHPNQIDESDIFPHIPNMFYFRPNDVIPPPSRRPGLPPPPPPMGFGRRHPGRPNDDVTPNGSVTTVVMAPSKHTTIKDEMNTKHKSKGSKKPNKEYVFTVLGFHKGPSSS